MSKPSIFFNFPYLNGIDVAQTPEWAKHTIWYQIFPDRFANGVHSIDSDKVEAWGSKPGPYSFVGGDLQGVIDKLDYLQHLGVNGIYFCPIFYAKANHRYDTIDYMEIDPRLGTKDTFKKLVNEAHKRGIRIMLDAEEFKYMVNEASISYARQIHEVNFNLLDSHDTTRILSIAKGDKNKVKQAYLFMFIHTGAPCIYYGDEIGLHSGIGEIKKSNRGCMVWDERGQDRELFNYIKKLVKLRKENLEFKSVKIEWVETNPETGLVILKKDGVTIIINNSNKEVEVTIPDYLANKEAVDLYVGIRIRLGKEIKLKPYGFSIIKQ